MPHHHHEHGDFIHCSLICKCLCCPHEQRWYPMSLVLRKSELMLSERHGLLVDRQGSLQLSMSTGCSFGSAFYMGLFSINQMAWGTAKSKVLDYYLICTRPLTNAPLNVEYNKIFLCMCLATPPPFPYFTPHPSQ